MSYSNENRAETLGNSILNEVEKFKLENKGNGYTHLEVDEFLDRLVKLVNVNADPDTVNTKGGMEKEFDNEYVKCGNVIIEDIKQVKFTQDFRGYDTVEVDKYLDDIIRLVRYNRNYKLVNHMIDTGAIGNMSFAMGWRGYDTNEVGMFINRLSTEMEKLNEIKNNFKK